MTDLLKVEKGMDALSKHILAQLDEEIRELKEKSAKSALDKACNKKFR